MSKIKFVYENNFFYIIEEGVNIIESALKKYEKMIGEKDLLFFYKGINISENKEMFNKINKNRNNNIIITVIKGNKKKIKNEIRNIICPECKNLTFFNINKDNIIKIDYCINKHKN